MIAAEYSTADIPVALDRRRSERFPASSPVTVRLLDTGQALAGTVTDASERGFQLRLDCEIKPWSLVEIRMTDTLILGEVVYCEAGPSGFRVGVHAAHGIFGLAALAESLRKNW